MKILGKEGLRDLDFNVSKGKVTSRQAEMLNKVEEEIPSASDVDKVDDIELQEIAKSMEDLIFQIKDAQTDTDDRAIRTSFAKTSRFRCPTQKYQGLSKS